MSAWPRAFWPPVAAWAVALASLAIIAALMGNDPFAPSTWERWDSAHYESIAVHGYDVHRCTPGETDNGARWCGNTAWLPGYPLLIAAVRLLGAPTGAAALAISWLFALVAFLLLWRLFLRDLPKTAAAPGLAYAAFAPGQVYLFAVFPISMFVAFTILFLGLLRRERWLAAGIAGFAALLCYPIGVILPVVALVWAFATHRSVRRAFTTAAITACAFPIVVIVQRIQTGRWTAFFDVQSAYGHGVHDPFGVFWNLMLILIRSGDRFSHYNAVEWQTLVATLIVVAVVAHSLVRRRQLTRTDLLLVIWSIAAWIFPLTQANVSVWRSQAALLPIAPLVGKLPRPLAALAIAGAIAVSIPIARLYFEGRLI